MIFTSQTLIPTNEVKIHKNDKQQRKYQVKPTSKAGNNTQSTVCFLQKNKNKNELQKERNYSNTTMKHTNME